MIVKRYAVCKDNGNGNCTVVEMYATQDGAVEACNLRNYGQNGNPQYRVIGIDTIQKPAPDRAIKKKPLAMWDSELGIVTEEMLAWGKLNNPRLVYCINNATTFAERAVLERMLIRKYLRNQESKQLTREMLEWAATHTKQVLITLAYARDREIWECIACFLIRKYNRENGITE